MSKTKTIELGKLDPRLRGSAHARETAIEGPTPERRRRGSFAHATTYERDAEGERKPARAVRDLNASAAKRLARCRELTAAQVMAAVLFERDHETARLEPRVTANLLSSGAAKRVSLSDAVVQARDRKHHALNALRLGGPDVVRVVEDVVLNSVTVTDVGKMRHRNKDSALAWAGMALSAGLHMLEAHYRASGRIAG